MLGEVIDQDYHGQIGLFLHSRSKTICVWSKGDPLGYLLVQLCSVFKVSDKLQKPNPCRMTKGSDPSEAKVWVIPPAVIHKR